MSIQKYNQNFYTKPIFGLLSAAPEDLFPGFDSELEDVTERLKPLIDAVQDVQPIEQAPLAEEISRLRNYIDPLWAESVAFATTVFEHAGVEHEEWPLVSSEIDVEDATSWFAERAHEFGAGITAAQKAALDAQKEDLDSKADSARKVALDALKKRLDSEAFQAQKAAVDAALAAHKKDLAAQFDSMKEALEKELKTAHDELKTVLHERDDAREANKSLEAQLTDLSTHNKRTAAEISAANDQAIELVSRLCNDLHVTLKDHNSASWPKRWKDVSNDLHGQIQSAHEAQRTLQTETLEAAEKFAQAVFDVQGISYRWPKLEWGDLTSIKIWFACRRYDFEQATKRDKIAREGRILKGLHHFALFSTGATSFPRTLQAGCDLSALERWLGDRTSEVSERLCSLREKLDLAISIAVWSFRLQDRLLARWAEETERTGMLRDRLRILAGRYRELLSARCN